MSLRHLFKDSESPGVQETFDPIINMDGVFSNLPFYESFTTKENKKRHY